MAVSPGPPWPRTPMIGLIQRVREAAVDVGGERVGAIGSGLLVLVGVRRDDDERNAARLVERILGYRMFADDRGRMNLNLTQTGGGLLLVPQFTLAADTRSGRRPGFDPAAPPARAEALFDHLVRTARDSHPAVATGRFGAHMQVRLTNDGPVTLWLEA